LKYISSINIDDEMLQNVDANIFPDKKPNHVILHCVKQIYDFLFKNESVVTQTQILKGLIKLKRVKEATSLLGIQKLTKDRKMFKNNVFENIASALKYFWKI